MAKRRVFARGHCGQSLASLPEINQSRRKSVAQKQFIVAQNGVPAPMQIGTKMAESGPQ